ncbi:unnamed protein product [Rotaria sp. Silwood2]|nr:unnamed protein product [Rotaria sp. Silwood2]CAF4329048.1 unnamed protein product [Rotaria sp. Silwood2]
MFAINPAGPMPIVLALRRVLRDKQYEIEEWKLLILLATDGVLTDSQGHGDDDDCIEYLNDWDKKIPNLDVVNDYCNEKREIQARQGKEFPFSFGDYAVKFLMSGVDSWFDDLDEKKVAKDDYGRPTAGVCDAHEKSKCILSLRKHKIK